MGGLLGKITRRIGRMKKNVDTMLLKSRAYPTLSWLGRQPGNNKGCAKILGLDFEYVDGSSLSSMYRAQFFRKKNDFWCAKPNPVILDCGANIGVSVLRYKHLFPQSRIIAFEPDPIICNMLKRNLKVNHADNVEVVEAAVWINNGTITFSMDHVESGRIEANKDKILAANKFVAEMRSVRLADYLNEPVDFVKLDIEGAEYEVLRDCGDKLRNVEKMIVEVHYTVDHPDLMGKIWMLLYQAGMKVMSSVWQPGGSINDLSQPFEKRTQSYDQWHCIYAWH